MHYILVLIISMLVYHYILFPVMLYIISLTSCHNHNKVKDDTITVSFIVAALNEEKIICQKIANCFEIDYPSNKVQYIFVLDGSTDGSYEIVNSYTDQGIVCLYDPQRRGKTAAINRAMEVATGDIVIFSDANSMFDRKALIHLLQNFADESIGGVCGRKGIIKNIDRAASTGDSFFWSIESIIKTLESKIGSISTGDGEIFAIRRELYHTLPEYIINDDTAITFNIICDGYRVVYEPSAVTYEEASLTLKDDFNVKVRMVAGGYQTLKLYGRSFFTKFPFFAIQFFSHKVIRWLMPVFLILLFVCSAFSFENMYFRYLLILQLVFYFFAFVGHFFSIKLFYFPQYYVVMNIAAFIGLYRFVIGDVGTKLWKKAQR